MLKVKEDFILGPDGSVCYKVLEDHDPVVNFNNEQANTTGGWTPDREMRQLLRVPARMYNEWRNRYPGCWEDEAFVRSFMLEHPEYRTVRFGTF